MNYYVVVEGRVGEKKVYKTWVPQINPVLSYVNHITDIHENNFLIMSGDGYPSYFDTIENAIDDANAFNSIDRLVICVDAEEMSYEEKYREISEFTASKPCRVEVKIVIQYFCFEAWALGNRLIGPRKNNLDEVLKRYSQHYNVLHNNPEYLPAYPPENLNRSQFATKYLKKLINRKYGTYTKSNPSALANPKYFGQVKSRFLETAHILSFGKFLAAFS